MRRLSPALALLALAACATTEAAPPPAPACPPTRDWSAWIDAMPGPGSQLRLIVTGEADVPAGLRATLKPGPMDRMMPPGQRIVLALEPGKGPSGWQQVRAEIKSNAALYREVIVTCGGEQVWRIEGSTIETAH